MAEPFLGEVRLFSFEFAPRGWALCNGQLLPINQNQALFSLLGTTFGGDGRVNFALPDLRGRVPIHVGSGHTLGERGGEQAHTLSTAELPTHTHLAHASNLDADTPDLAGHVLARTAVQIYHPPDLMSPQLNEMVSSSEVTLMWEPVRANAFASVAEAGKNGDTLTLGAMAAGTVANAGGSQAHLNMQPFLTLSFCIALQGLFPSPNQFSV